MKKSIFKFAFVALASGIALSSCMSSAEKVEASGEKVENAEENLDQAQKDYDAQYAQFKLESNEQISANEQLIMDLKVYSKDKKAETKANYEKAIADLEAKNQELKVKVEAQKATNSEKWQSFKNEFNHDMEELGKSLKDLNKDNVK